MKPAPYRATKCKMEVLRKSGGKPLGDAGAGEGVGDAEVEVLLEVRERIGMDDEAGGSLGREDADEVFVRLDKVHQGGDAVRYQEGTRVHVLVHERAVRRPDGVAGLLREVRTGSGQCSLNGADDGAGVKVQGVLTGRCEQIEVRIHRLGESGLRISIYNEGGSRDGQEVSQQIREEMRCGEGGRGDADGAVHRHFSGAAEERVGRFVPVQDLRCVLLENVSLCSEGHFSPLPLEECGTHLLLQFRDILTHGRLGDAQVLGGPGEAAFLRHHHEDAQSEIVEHNKISLYFNTK